MKALIFGGESQSGYYLKQFLERKNYEVISLSRNQCNIQFAKEVDKALREYTPDEVYNFAALMFAPNSWNNPQDYATVNYIGVINILLAIRRFCSKAKFFQAGAADIFSRDNSIKNERSLIQPDTPYGISKASAYHLVKVFRLKQYLFACTGILFNMESPRRKDMFFSRTVIKGVVDIAKGRCNRLTLWDLTPVRDWGLTQEYVEAMWLMLQNPLPNDYVIATGKSASCRSFVELACNAVAIDFDMCIDHTSKFACCDYMQADPASIQTNLHWKAKVDYTGLIPYLIAKELEING